MKEIETLKLPYSIENIGTVYQDRNQVVDRVVASFDSFKKEYFVSNTGSRAALLGVCNDKILFFKQYRLLINAISYEIPGGKINDAESPVSAARRETFEETGILFIKLNKLIEYHYSLDTVLNYTYLFYSETPEPTPMIENSRIQWISIRECLDMINKGIIIDSMSIIAILAYSSLKRIIS